MIKTYKLVKYTTTQFDMIAGIVGFSSAQTLNKAFKRYCSCTLSVLHPYHINLA